MNLNVYSQHGEETVIERYLGRIEKGTYIDIGADSPKELSNTYALYEIGWRGLLVEPMPHNVKELKAVRPEDIVEELALWDSEGELIMKDNVVENTPLGDQYKAGYNPYPNAVRKEHRVKCTTLPKLLEKYPQFNNVDFLSLDVETAEETILKTVDFTKFKPKLMCIEFKVRNDDYRKNWEKYVLPYYTEQEILFGNVFYLRKPE